MSEPEPIQLTEDAQVSDAFVDFTGGSKGQLKVIVDGDLDSSSAFPVPADEEGDNWIAENEAGLFWGWSATSVQPPADVDPYDTRVPVEHEDEGEVQRVPQLNHVVKKQQIEREPESVVSVSYTNTHPNTIPTRIELAQEIADKYVNGPLGSECASFWAYRHADRSNTFAGNRNGGKYGKYVDADVVAYYAPIYTWKFKRVQDVDPEDDRLYEETGDGVELEA